MGVVINMNNIGRIKTDLSKNEAAVVDNMCKSKSNVNRFLSQYVLVLDRIMQLVSNLGLARCYSGLCKPRVDNAERESQNLGFNAGNTKTEVTQSLPVVKIHEAELPQDAFIAHTYDIIATSNGWRNIIDISNIVRVHYIFDLKTELIENERLAAIIVGYLEMRRLITFRIVVGDVARLEEIAEEMHKVFFEVNNIDWTRLGTFEKILIMFKHIEKLFLWRVRDKG